MDTLETWLAFRRHETAAAPTLTCCDCGGRAQGNAFCDDGELCDGCVAEADAANAAIGK